MNTMALRASTRGRQNVMSGFAIAAILSASGCAGSGESGPDSVEGQQPVGRVTMRQVHAAFIGSGSGGQGTLYFQGRTYPFTVGGAGIGGIGASTVEAEGDVFKRAMSLI